MRGGGARALQAYLVVRQLAVLLPLLAHLVCGPSDQWVVEVTASGLKGRREGVVTREK
jgi:hypothetical protein